MRQQHGFGKKFLRIVFPSIMVIILFIISFYVIFLPAIEKNMMNAKKEMILELTNSAWSILEEYHYEVQQGNMSESEAKQLAIKRIENIRYGDARKDYFWITDTTPTMVMHPYMPRLNNKDLSDYTDPEGKKLFVEAAGIVQKKDAGYLHYMWQWKDDSLRIVPKLSYVKGFEPWGWIIGTGIYIEDVKEEINTLKSRLVKSAFAIFFIISIFVAYGTRHSLLIEKKRRETEESLRQSRLKYKALVEASTEGTLMLLDDKIIYSNNKISELTGFDENSIRNKSCSEIFTIQNSKQQIHDLLPETGHSQNIQAILETKNGAGIDVVLTISNININEKKGYIFIVKETTRNIKREQSQDKLAEELQNSLHLMNLPIEQFIRKYFSTDINTTITDASKLMARKKQDVLVITKEKLPMGIITSHDFYARVISENLNTSKPVSAIMSSPVIMLNEKALIYEALFVMGQKQIKHLCVKDEQGNLIGIVHKNDLLEIQYNSTSYLLKEIEKAELIEDIQAVYDRLAGIINLLLNSGANPKSITRITTSISDAITKRLIDLAIEKLGKPPVNFAFITLGSEGRQEQTLKTDQDNAIIFEPAGNTDLKKTQHYFLELAKIINEWLDNIGYEYCIGEIMARNEKWCQPISKWKAYFTKWIENSDPESILDVSVFFDFRIVYGDDKLVEQLRGFINDTTDNKAVFFHHMMQSIQRFKPPVNLLGNIVSNSKNNQSNVLDIKKVMVPITGFARIYAIKHKLSETNTPQRLKNLQKQQVLKQNIINEALQAYDFLMMLRFKTQSKKILSNNTIDNYINLDELTEIELSVLKKTLSEISGLLTQLNIDFKGTI